MTREEILEAAQESTPEIGEAERDIMRRSLLHSMIVVVIVCIVMIIIEWVVVRKIDFGKPALLVLFSGVSDFLEGKKNNTKKKLTLGIVQIIAALALVLLYIGALIV